MRLFHYNFVTFATSTNSAFTRCFGFGRFLFGYCGFWINIWMNNKKLQAANMYLVNKFSDWVTHMLTLTMYERKAGAYVIEEGWAKGAINTYESEIDEIKARNLVRYVVEALNYRNYKKKGRKQRYKNCCRILAIPVLEGVNGSKRMHVHLLLGNLATNQLERIKQDVAEILEKTEWGMRRFKLDETYCAEGAAYYLSKEVGFCNNDAVCWELASIPGRLLGVWA